MPHAAVLLGNKRVCSWIEPVAAHLEDIGSVHQPEAQRNFNTSQWGLVSSLMWANQGMVMYVCFMSPMQTTSQLQSWDGISSCDASVYIPAAAATNCCFFSSQGFCCSQLFGVCA